MTNFNYQNIVQSIIDKLLDAGYEYESKELEGTSKAVFMFQTEMVGTMLTEVLDFAKDENVRKVISREIEELRTYASMMGITIYKHKP